MGELRAKTIRLLKEIAKCEGAYNYDELTQAFNTIDSMKKLANDAIKPLQIDLKDEKGVLAAFQKMCEQSLDPEQFEMFETIKKALKKVRKEL